jgi:hypothetical protein
MQGQTAAFEHSVQSKVRLFAGFGGRGGRAASWSGRTFVRRGKSQGDGLAALLEQDRARVDGDKFPSGVIRLAEAQPDRRSCRRIVEDADTLAFSYDGSDERQ